MDGEKTEEAEEEREREKGEKENVIDRVWDAEGRIEKVNEKATGGKERKCPNGRKRRGGGDDEAERVKRGEIRRGKGGIIGEER